MKKRNLHKIIVGLLILGGGFFIVHRYYTTSGTYSFKQITSFQEAQSELSTCNKDTLIVFDIDDTLLRPVDAVVNFAQYPYLFRLNILLSHPFLFMSKKWEYYASIVWKNIDWQLMQDDIPALIDTLKRQCTVIALTAIETGRFGIIENFIQWRKNLLKRFNINFDTQFGNAVFKTLPSYRANYPELAEGVLYCNGISKGKVLGAFLDYAHLQPHTIIFFDDIEKNLISVEQMCKTRNICFIGFHYIRKKQYITPWNGKRILFQIDHLIKNNQWLSDKDADSMISCLPAL